MKDIGRQDAKSAKKAIYVDTQVVKDASVFVWPAFSVVNCSIRVFLGAPGVLVAKKH